MDFLRTAWSFEYALLPCLMAYFIFEIPIIYRRITRRMYVPIYFAFFPFGHTDELYAQYFDEDDFWQVGPPLTEADRPNARVRIIWLSMLSLVLTVIISPFLTAFFCVYFLTPSQFTQFLWTLTVAKSCLLCCSLYGLRYRYRVTDLVPLPYLTIIYAVYLAVILSILSKSDVWIRHELRDGGLTGLALSLFDFVVFDIGIYVLFISVISWLIPWRLTQFTPEKPDNVEE